MGDFAFAVLKEGACFKPVIEIYLNGDVFQLFREKESEYELN